MIYPRIAIVGRPNVGKSTLFNRLCGKNIAIVEDRPGVTRDWREGRAALSDFAFDVIDTPGLDGFESPDLKKQINQNTAEIMKSSDILLFMVDGREGLLASDQDLAHQIRRSKKPVIFLVNKSESKENTAFIEAQSLGLSDNIISFSGLHGLGLEELYESLAKIFSQKNIEVPKPPKKSFETARSRQAEKLKEQKALQALAQSKEDVALKVAFKSEEGDFEEGRDFEDDDIFQEGSSEKMSLDQDASALQIAIFGRPNAGKSTLINKLLGTDRLIVGDQPGVTRDAIRIDWSYEGRPLKLVDTAGVRRRSKVTDRVEQLSVREALQAVKFSQVCVLVVDALSPIDKQDLLLGGKILEEGRALVIAINKWDRLEKESFDEIKYKVGKSLSQVKGVPIVPISALRGKNLDRLMKAVFEMEEHWNARIPTQNSIAG